MMSDLPKSAGLWYGGQLRPCTLRYGTSPDTIPE